MENAEAIVVKAESAMPQPKAKVYRSNFLVLITTVPLMTQF